MTKLVHIVNGSNWLNEPVKVHDGEAEVVLAPGERVSFGLGQFNETTSLTLEDATGDDKPQPLYRDGEQYVMACETGWVPVRVSAGIHTQAVYGGAGYHIQEAIKVLLDHADEIYDPVVRGKAISCLHMALGALKGVGK